MPLMMIVLALSAVLSDQPKAAPPQGPFDSFKEFTATMVGGLLNGSDQVKVYRLGSEYRVDNEKGYTVTNLDQSSTLSVYTEKNMCTEFEGLSWQSFPVSSRFANTTVQRSAGGEETLDGHPCKIETLEVTWENGVTNHWKVWEAQDLGGFPVKIEVHHLGGRISTAYFKDVSLKAPDASLLKRPPGCKKFQGQAIAPARKPAPAKPAAPTTDTAPPKAAPPPK